MERTLALAAALSLLLLAVAYKLVFPHLSAIAVSDWGEGFPPSLKATL